MDERRFGRLRGRARWPGALAVAAALCLLAAFACGGGTTQDAGVPDTSTSTSDTASDASGSADSSASTRAVGYSVGDQAPEFSVQSVRGGAYTLSAITASGDPVLLYFFATW